MVQINVIRPAAFLSMIVFLSLFVLMSLHVSADEPAIVLSDDFNDNFLNTSLWTQDVVGTGNSFTEINQEANFTTYGHGNWDLGHSILWSKNLSIENWKSITISGKWKFINPYTAEMRCLLFDADTEYYVGATYATWDISVPDEHLRLYNDLGSYEKYLSEDVPTTYVNFDIILTHDEIKYVQDGILIGDAPSTVLSSTSNFKLQIGGWDASSFYQYMFFDDVQINVTFLEPTVTVDDDFDETTPGWNETCFNSIQEGIDAVINGGTVYVNNGSYLGEIFLDKTVLLTGENTNSVWINGTIYVYGNSTVIENMTLCNASGGDFPCGIYDDSSNSIYKNLHLYNNERGIELSYESLNTVIIDNLFTENFYGIIMYESMSNSYIANNHIENNTYGISISASSNNTLFHNIIINNAEAGLSLLSSSDNLIYDNYFHNSLNVDYDGGSFNSWNISKTPGLNILGGELFGGNYWNDYIGFDNDSDGIGDNPYDIPEVLIDYFPLMYNYNYIEVNDDADPGWYDETHLDSISEAVEIANDGASIFVFNGTYYDYVFIDKSIHLTGESTIGVVCDGSEMWYDYFFDINSDNVSIQNLTVVYVHIYEGEGPAFAIRSDGNNTRFSNMILVDNDNGISIQNSNNVTISDNNITNNDNGISIQNSNHIEIFSNSLSYNLDGIHVLNSNYLNLINNSIFGFYYPEEYTLGIIFENATDNNVTGNFIQDNGEGIVFLMSSNNTIFNNYFGNFFNVYYVEGENINRWNVSKTPGVNIIGGPYIGGNYWNYYVGFDNDSDGIVDTPYILDVNDGITITDSFPLTVYFNVYNSIPADGSSNVEPGSLKWVANFSYLEFFPPVYWSIECSNGQSIEIYGEEEPFITDNVSIDLIDLQYGATYTIWVNVSCGPLSKTFVFTFTIKNKSQEKNEITNIPPVAHAGGPYAGYPSEQISFYGGSSYDPDGEIVSYSWSFGDGTNAQGASASHSYSKQGTYTVTLSVTDNEGATSSSSTRVVIIQPNNPPELLSSVSTNPGEFTASLIITASDKDGDDILCSISWGDGTSTSITLTDGQTTTQTHKYPEYGSYTISLSGSDGNAVTSRTHTISIISELIENEPTGSKGFSNIVTTNESFIENQIDERSLIGGVMDKKYVIPAATILSIILLFLLNLLVEFLSDYSSEKALDYRESKKSPSSKKKTKGLAPHKFLTNREILSVIVTTILLAFVLSWTWVPQMSSFWEFFVVTLIIVACMIILRESLRCYLCHKHKLASEFYIWPLGSIMMIVSTFIGNTFSLAANHNYDDEGEIKKCGKVTFTVSLILYLIVVASFIANILFPSVIFQMIVIATVLNLFIDLFPFKPMDGYEIRHWNIFIWVIFYVIVIISYIVVYFNLYP